MTTPTIPMDLSIYHGKVISIFDLRAQRILQESTEKLIAEEVADPSIGNQMTDKERIWWRNHQFFADRMARSSFFGSLKYELGQLSGVRSMRLTCDAYQAFYFLKVDLTIDFGRDPILVRWSCGGEPEFPVTKGPGRFIIDSEEA